MKFRSLYGYNRDILERVSAAIIEPIKEGRFELLSPGYLFFGPPGTGKTPVIKAIAAEARGVARFYRAEIVEMMMASGTPDRFKDSFDRIVDRARKNSPSLIYVDKPERIEGSGLMDEMPVHSIGQAYLGEKMKELDGRGVSFLVETQDPYELDSSLFGHGKIEDIFLFDFPDEERLTGIIEHYLGKRTKKSEHVRAVNILKGLSPGDVETVMRKTLASRKKKRDITPEDIERVRKATSFFTSDRLAGNASRFWRSYGPISMPQPKDWDTIVGLEVAKREFARIEKILREPDFAERFGLELPKGILLYGPPGCGKTMLTRIMGARLGIHFIHQSASELHSTYWGEAKNKVKGLFNEAERKSPSMIFLDDIDTLKSRHIPGESGAALSEIITQILYELDGIKERKGILFIGATNLPWEMDEALMRPGRIDKKIFVPPPDYTARQRLFEMYLKGKPAKRIDTARLASLTENYSGADIREVCTMAAEEVADIYIERGKSEKITMDRMLKIIRGYKPAITPSLLRAYAQYSKKASHPGRYIA